MASVINVQPSALDLLLYAGDGVEFRLICTNSDGSPVNVNGSVRAQVRLNRDEGSTELVDFDCTVLDAPGGIVHVALTGDQTQELMDDPSSSNGKFVGVWDLEWTADDAEPRTLVQGKVECVADVTR
jgi:hypothetical protein